jgi:hypothetical protein
MFARLKNGAGYEAYLNTFYCPVQPWAGSREENGEPIEYGYEETLSDASLSLRPNPSAGWVMVDVQPWVGQRVQLRIVDTQGRIVMNQSYAIESEWLDLQMDVNLANGLYYLMVQPADGEAATAKFVLER